MAAFLHPNRHVGRALPARGAVLALALLATGCSSLEGVFPRFSGPTNVVATDSLTVQRIRGGNPSVEPLMPEGGNVWPAAEAPRATMMSGPEEAMRNIPDYRPSLIEPVPPASSPIGPRARRGTAGAPTPPLPLTEPPRSPVAEPAQPATRPPPRTEGRALTDPSGRPAIGTGGSGRVQGFTQPGVGGGAVIRDGNVETWVGPDGQTRTRVVPN